MVLPHQGEHCPCISLTSMMCSSSIVLGAVSFVFRSFCLRPGPGAGDGCLSLNRSTQSSARPGGSLLVPFHLAEPTRNQTLVQAQSMRRGGRCPSLPRHDGLFALERAPLAQEAAHWGLGPRKRQQQARYGCRINSSMTSSA